MVAGEETGASIVISVQIGVDHPARATGVVVDGFYRPRMACFRLASILDTFKRAGALAPGFCRGSHIRMKDWVFTVVKQVMGLPGEVWA